MGGVRIVCDSTADLEPAYRQAHDVSVVPLKVIFGEEVYEDGETIHPAEFYSRMAATMVHPRTSQPTPAEFEAVFRDVGGAGTTVLCTTISSELSGTYASAVQAKAALPELDIRLLDTRSVAVGHSAVVRAAVEAVDSGADAAGAEAAARRVMESQRILFTVETLEYLRRGGRIGGARALLGSMLDIKPILSIEDGAIEPVDRVRTFQRAIHHIVAQVASAAGSWLRTRVTIAHGNREAAARQLAQRLSGVEGVSEVLLAEVGPVVGCHAGPGVIGVGFHPLAQVGTRR